MKLLVVVMLVAAAAARPDDSHYDTKYDNFDIDVLMGNPKLMENYIFCFLGTGRCTPEGKDFKRLIPEGTRTSCAKCTEKQKVLVAKFIDAIQTKFPQHWADLSKQVDPKEEHTEDLKKFLQENLTKTVA